MCIYMILRLWDNGGNNNTSHWNLTGKNKFINLSVLYDKIWHKCRTLSNVIPLRVWAVFGWKRIHSTLYWKGSIVSAGIRTLDPWITRWTLYRWAIWLADKKDKFWTISSKMLSSNINIIATTDVFLIKMWQKWYTRREPWLF